MIALLREEKHPPAGVFHMFEGDSSSAMQVLGMDYFIGIGGSVTFKNNARVAQILTNLGISRVVLETDSPYIAPHPFRGTVNEPGRIPIIAKRIAEILETQVELIAEETTRNAISLFKLD
jgi:TatD DNase family protein